MSESFRNLIVWQKALESSKRIYRITQLLPKEEIYGLTSQIRRSSVSIAANIAEGSQRSTSKDFSNFLRIADGSASELETLFLIAQDAYPSLQASVALELESLREIQKMLGSLTEKYLHKPVTVNWLLVTCNELLQQRKIVVRLGGRAGLNPGLHKPRHIGAAL